MSPAYVLPAILALAASSAPAAAGLDEVGRYVFVPNRASADVAVIDSRTDTLAARIPVGRVPHQVVVADTLGKLVASNTADDTITIVDLGTLETETTLPLGHEPEHMELSPDGRTLAVGNIKGGSVSFVALAENREIARVDGLVQPHNLTFSPDGALLYVANLGADHVSVIDVAQREIVNEIHIAPPMAVAGDDPGDEFQGIINVTRTPDGRLGFAAHGHSGRMAVIDLRTQEVLRTLELGSLPWRAYTTADGRFMMVPNNGEATVSVVSTSTLDVVATLPGAFDMTGVNTGWFETTAAVISRGEDKVVFHDLMGMAPAGELALAGAPETGVVTPDGTKLYVALSEANQVAVVDMRTRELLTLIDGVGEEPWGATMVGAVNYCH